MKMALRCPKCSKGAPAIKSIIACRISVAGRSRLRARTVSSRRSSGVRLKMEITGKRSSSTGPMRNSLVNAFILFLRQKPPSTPGVLPFGLAASAPETKFAGVSDVTRICSTESGLCIGSSWSCRARRRLRRAEHLVKNCHSALTTPTTLRQTTAAGSIGRAGSPMPSAGESTVRRTGRVSGTDRRQIGASNPTARRVTRGGGSTRDRLPQGWCRRGCALQTVTAGALRTGFDYLGNGVLLLLRGFERAGEATTVQEWRSRVLKRVRRE